MDSTVNQIALSLGIGPEWVWFGLGAISMLVLRSIIGGKKAALSPQSLRRQPGSIVGSTLNSTSTSFNHITNGSSTSLGLEDSSELKALLGAGNKIGAIKLIREKSGLGLAEAKSVCEALEKAIQNRNPK